MLDGDAVPRSVLEPESPSRKQIVNTDTLKGSSQLVFSPGRSNISPLKRHLRENPTINLNHSQRLSRLSTPLGRVSTASTNRSRQSTASSISPPRMMLAREQVREAEHVGTPLYEVLEAQRVSTPKEYFNRFQTPQHEVLTDHDKLIHTARAAFHNHIYQDDNYVRIYQEKRIANTAERLWNSREKSIKDLQNSWTSEVKTTTPNNKKALGLTPLRRIGWGQDKPHHIPVTNNIDRIHTKLPMRVDGRGNVWSLAVPQTGEHS